MLRRFLAIGAIALSCGSCTAVKVLTHSTTDDPVELPSGAYQLDPHHWSVTFDVDHFGYSRFVMRFDRAKADLDFNAASPEQSRVKVAIDAASIDTNVAELDALVKSDALLEAEKYPEIEFVARELRRTGKNSGEMAGELTIHGESRPIVIAVTLHGGGTNPLNGDETLGFSGNTHVDRAAFGLFKWYPAVGNDIHVAIEAEFVRHPSKS